MATTTTTTQESHNTTVAALNDRLAELQGKMSSTTAPEAVATPAKIAPIATEKAPSVPEGSENAPSSSLVTTSTPDTLPAGLSLTIGPSESTPAIQTKTTPANSSATSQDINPATIEENHSEAVGQAPSVSLSAISPAPGLSKELLDSTTSSAPAARRKKEGFEKSFVIPYQEKLMNLAANLQQIRQDQKRLTIQYREWGADDAPASAMASLQTKIVELEREERRMESLMRLISDTRAFAVRLAGMNNEISHIGEKRLSSAELTLLVEEITWIEKSYEANAIEIAKALSGVV